MGLDPQTVVNASRLTDGVTRMVLDNGLTVLIKPNHTSAVTALLVSVKAGYFNEEDAVSGIAHVIEHMIFKGTPQRPDGEQFAREIRELGGTLNAATYYEETYYYVVVPSRNAEQALEIQADALQNALFDAAELAKEIEVIVQESLQKRDNPMAMLTESLYELAYDKHRIRRWRIGHPDSLRRLTRDDLNRFVQSTYRPENMVVGIVGDCDVERAAAMVERCWGSVPRGTMQREVSPEEPFHRGLRYAYRKGEHKQRLLLFNFPAPPILHPDAPALLLLSAILSDGRSARLYRKLKEELQIANSVWANFETFEQMGIFKIGAECIADDPLQVERAIWEEIRRVQTEPVLESELERIRTRMEAGRLYGQEEVYGMARTLVSYELLGDYHLADIFNERINAVTASDLKRVANEYLQLSAANLLEYMPSTIEAPERTPEDLLAALSEKEPSPQITQISQMVSVPAECSPNLTNQDDLRTPSPPHPLTSSPSHPDARLIALPNGATLVFKPRNDLPIVSVQALFHGGKSLEDRTNSGLTGLMLRTSLKGTRRYSAEEIANRIEALGSGIGFSAGPDYFGYGFKIRRSNLLEGFDLFTDVVVHPIFPEDEVDREQQAIYGELRRQQDNMLSLAFEQLSAAYYGRHPYGLPSLGIEAAVAAQNHASVQKWHAANVSADRMVVSIVGDVTESKALALVSDMFAKDSQHTIGAPPETFLGPEPPGELSLNQAKKQTALALGFTGAKLGSEDRYALDILDEVTSAMGGRFFRAVRGDAALAYSVSSVHRSRRDAGNFIAYASMEPKNEMRVREILLAECARLTRELITPDELRTARAAVFGEHVIGTQTFSAQASELAYFALNGLPLDEAERYLARIDSVTEEDVLRAAVHYLTPDRYWVGVVRGSE